MIIILLHSRVSKVGASEGRGELTSAALVRGAAAASFGGRCLGLPCCRWPSWQLRPFLAAACRRSRGVRHAIDHGRRAAAAAAQNLVVAADQERLGGGRALLFDGRVAAWGVCVWV